ncbi:MAG: alpha-ketoacid dehydrogenase subunit beta [Gammaproteobacteria bacterium]|nr:alpha-ketoacid dehydrogenase subunit beta [Gammaproteobacteria bacterium]
MNSQPPAASTETSYGEAIRAGFVHLLSSHREVFAIGQGLWSPWYVGNSMTDLDKLFGKARVIDTPVSELACTGAAVGAALCGYRPIVIHPRMDFMVLAADQIINQAAKWHHMLGGQAIAPVTIRAIINRGGEQGAQHSQALHAWFAHIPGLRVVMPSSVADARDLLVASVLCDDPVLYIDDRWLYERKAVLPAVSERPLAAEGPRVVRSGTDITLVGAGYSSWLCEQAAEILAAEGLDAEVIDVRVLNPFDPAVILASVSRTGRLCVVDGGWRNAGWAGEVIASVAEALDPRQLKSSPRRITLPNAPAPTSRMLEADYYIDAGHVAAAARTMLAARETAS